MCPQSSRVRLKLTRGQGGETLCDAAGRPEPPRISASTAAPRTVAPLMLPVPFARVGTDARCSSGRTPRRLARSPLTAVLARAGKMSRDSEETQYCFLVEWNDVQAALVRKYHLFWFSDNTIEMVPAARISGTPASRVTALACPPACSST
jgi:hypothetical protein